LAANGIETMVFYPVPVHRLKLCRETMNSSPTTQAPHRPRLLVKVGVLLSGGVLAQIIGLLMTPFIVRIYSPEHFGLLGVYLAILGVVAPVCMFRYEMAIPGTRQDRTAATLFLLAVTLALGFSGAAAVLLVACHQAGLFRPILGTLLWWMIPLGIFLTGLYGVASTCAIRKAAFKDLARTKVNQSLWMMLGQWVLGKAGWRPGGLLLGQILGQSGGSGYLLWTLWREDRSLIRSIRPRDLLATARAHTRFPKFSLPAVLIESLAANLPTLAMAYFYSATVAGWVTMLQRTIWIPLTSLAVNLGQVNFADFSEVHRKDPRDGLAMFLKRVKYLFLGGLAFAAFIALVVPWGIHRFLSREWASSIACMYILLPMAVANFIVSPFGSVLDAYHRQDLHLQREIIRGAMLLAALVIGVAARQPWYRTLALMSAASLLGSTVYLWQSWKAVKEC